MYFRATARKYIVVEPRTVISTRLVRSVTVDVLSEITN
jgi:hypothetical protein